VRAKPLISRVQGELGQGWDRVGGKLGSVMIEASYETRREKDGSNRFGFGRLQIAMIRYNLGNYNFNKNN
jgi:hypothetical protein